MLVGFLGGVSLIACQQKPTVLSDSGDLIVKNPKAIEPLLARFSKDRKIILVDARSKFDFESFSIPGSLNFNLDEVQIRNTKGELVLNPDLFKISRRLANYGIAKDSQILFLGYGKAGSAEEAAMAFVFHRLGVKNVLAASIENFRAHPFPSFEMKSEALWMPDEKEFFINVSQLSVNLKEIESKNLSSKARQASLQMSLPVARSHGVLLSDSLDTPKWFEKSSLNWSTQVLNPMDFVDASGIWTETFVKSRLNFSKMAVVVIQSKNLQRALALAYLSTLAGAEKIFLLDSSKN